MVKTIKSPIHDGGLGLSWLDQQPHQQQQHPQQQQQQQQQLHFPMQQQVQTPMRPQPLPNFQQSFQPSVQPILVQQPLNINQITGHQNYNSGIPLGNTQASFKKETGSKALWAPPSVDPSYNLASTDYNYNYDKVQGLGNDTSPTQGFGTVQQYPQKENLKGNRCFQMIFPNDSSKLVVTPSSDPNGNKSMNTTNGSTFTVFMAHTLGHSANVRLFLVYSNDAESTNPVHPCKNHQVEDHPNHMLTVNGIGDSKYEEHHHPSIVVTPTPTGDIAHGNPSCLKYCAQVEFHCRNSCLNRKDLTLVCQLEENGIVHGRECLEVKVSACPRRDAKVKDKKKTTTTTTLADTKDLFSLASPRPLKRTSDEAFEPQSADALTPVDDLQRFAYLCYMEKRFQQIFPEQHKEAKKQFPSWWAARWNSIDDN